MQLIPRAITALWPYKYRLATNPAAALACASLWDIKSRRTTPDGDIAVTITRAPASRLGTLAAFVAAEVAKGRAITLNPGAGLSRNAWCLGSPTPAGEPIWSTRRLDAADADYSDNSEAFVIVEPTAGWLSPGATQVTSPASGSTANAVGGQIALVTKTVTAPWIYHYRSIAPADAAAALACAALWDMGQWIDDNGNPTSSPAPDWLAMRVVRAPAGRKGTLASWIAAEAARGQAILVDPADGISRSAWCTGSTLGAKGKVISTRRLDYIDYTPEVAPESFVLVEPSAGWLTPTTASQVPSRYASMAAPAFDWKKYALPAGLAVGGLVLLGVALSD